MLHWFSLHYLGIAEVEFDFERTSEESKWRNQVRHLKIKWSGSISVTNLGCIFRILGQNFPIFFIRLHQNFWKKSTILDLISTRTLSWSTLQITIVDAVIAKSKTNVSVPRVLRLNYEWQREVDTCLLKSLSDWIAIDNCVRALVSYGIQISATKCGSMIFYVLRTFHLNGWVTTRLYLELLSSLNCLVQHLGAVVNEHWFYFRPTVLESLEWWGSAINTALYVFKFRRHFPTEK